MSSRWGAKPEPASSQSSSSSSRWGAPKGTSSTNATTTTTKMKTEPKEEQESTSAEPNWFDNSDDDDQFEVIDQVCWANDEPDPKASGLAFRPKPDYCDPCDCLPPDMEDDDDEDEDDDDDDEEEWGTKKKKKKVACMDMSCVLFACQEECRSMCVAGDACGNKRIQKKQWKPLKVFDAGKKGKGLKVREDCQKGDLIAEYVGKAIPKSYLPRLFSKYKRDRKLYIMALDKDIYLDAREKGGLARYINHSCDPNCVVERWKVRGIVRAAIFASKPIPKNTELSFDYQWERKRGRAPTKCHCGSANCRGTLEVPRSMEEVAMEKKLVGHWKKPFLSRAGREIVNRSIQVYHDAAQEYYAADVTQYNETTGQHLVMYRHDLEEVWEDLRNQDWMILDEDAEQFVIGKKRSSHSAVTPSSQRSLLSDSMMLPQQSIGSSNTTSTTGNGGAGGGDASGGGENLMISTSSNGTVGGGRVKNYLYVQTPIKEAFCANHHILDRCQRSCRVTITPQQFAKPPFPADPNDPEDVEKHRALEQTLDGTVWKLTIVGSDIAKAYSIVERNCAYLEKKLQAEAAEAEMLKKSGGDATGGGVGGGGGGALDAALSGGTSSSVPAADSNVAEVVLPRCITGLVKKRLNVIRESCRSVTITFVPSESKSKQFAKLILEGTLLSDVQSAKENLWTQLLAACMEAQAPMTPNGIPKDLGFFGGELTSVQFQQLLDYDKITVSSTKANTTTATTPGASSATTTPSNATALSSSSPTSLSTNLNDSTVAMNASTSSTSAGAASMNASSPTNTALQQDAQEDLARRSPFFNSFESTQRCTIWVQSDLDKGRIDASNRVVSEAVPNAPRKIYFGCEPKEVPKLWNLVQQRATEVARGVKYLFLGPDRMYQPYMMRKGGEFFEFVRKATGASVTVDSMTGDHLRIDGREKINNGTNHKVVDLVEGTEAKDPISVSTLSTEGLSEGERAALAEELIRLQIELYRDHCIREQNWIFGRDWTLVRRSSAQRSAPAVDSLAAGSPSTSGSNNHHISSKPFSSAVASANRSLQFDAKTMSNACLEIADITSTLGVGGGVGAHAVVIFYRFASVVAARAPSESQLKIREIVLSCVFLANKAQKGKNWKKLEEVLEAAYSIFYPGAKFDRSKEEAVVLEEKVMSAETEILTTLDYDVFWRGAEWIVSAVTEAGGMEPKLARHALRFCFSGPVLAAGPDLWLLYGAEYIFAAAAGFLEADLEPLCDSLSLIPLKVLQAAEIIANSAKLSGQGKRGASQPSLHPLLQDGKETLLKHLPRLKQASNQLMIDRMVQKGANAVHRTSESEQRYRIIGVENRKRRVFRNVEASIVKNQVLPTMAGVSAESNCNIYIEENQGGGGGEDIVLEGSWRAIAIAAFLLEETVGERKLEDAPPPDNQNKVQAKGRSGLLQMQNIETTDAWTGTIQAQGASKSFMGRKTGGKCCLPGKITESGLRDVGLRWWIPPRYGPSPTGSICDMFLAKSNASEQLEGLANLTHAFVGDSPGFSMLTSALEKSGHAAVSDRYVAVSLQRWPAEKVSRKEEKHTQRHGMQLGFSAAAMQEMQLLSQLHSLIHSPQGHPNFVLPVGVALPSEVEDGEKSPAAGVSDLFDLNRIEDDIFSLTRTSEENEVAAQKERKRKDMITGPHIVFHPTPFVLQRFLLRSKERKQNEDRSFGSTIISSWFHDLLSALVHCHTNNVLLQMLQADHIVVDHSGVAKIGNLYRGARISPEEKKMDILDLAIQYKKRPLISEEELVANPFVAPEMLLGSPKHTKETDVWAMGCLLASLLLNKPLFQAKDRESKLMAMYKIVGVPSNDNYPAAVRFPKYKKPIKRYMPGVVKALQHMLKEEESKKHAGAIDLLSRMLHLDPAMRITAVQALSDEYMLNFIENANNSVFFREAYVQEWMGLKGKLLRSNQSEEDEIKARERGIKRKAMLIAATTKAVDDEEDDLYDMGDILDGGDGEPSKKQRSS